MTKEYNLITIEPLSKFPLIKDLKIDRSVLHEAMKKSNQWIEGKAKINENNSFEYQMALCLLCGCCVEACPNYNCEDFPGTPIAVSSAKLTSQETNKTHLKEIKKDYEKKFYPKCVKALVCEDICPMEIETQRAISKMNKSIWKIRDLFHIR